MIMKVNKQLVKSLIKSMFAASYCSSSIDDKFVHMTMLSGTIPPIDGRSCFLSA